MTLNHHQRGFSGLTRHRGLRVVALMALLGNAAQACQVPVFRYALERWEPAPYSLTITPGRGGLSAGEQEIVEHLRHPQTPANLEIEIKPPAEKPSLALQCPLKRNDDARQPIWQSELTPANAHALLDSPARGELRRRLLGGQTAVWVLLESGDAAKDAAAFATLGESMKIAQERLKLPEGVITQDEANDPTKRRENADVLQSDLPLKIEFSMLRLSRQNAEEATLIAMLMHAEPDLGDYVKEPMVFPVFGRGRALEPLIGKGIHADNLLEAAAYLCGACSCEIKEQNPGIDLLMAADWTPVASKEVIETVVITGADTASKDDESRRLLGMIVVAGMVALLLKGWLIARWFSRRKRRP